MLGVEDSGGSKPLDQASECFTQRLLDLDFQLEKFWEWSRHLTKQFRASLERNLISIEDITHVPVNASLSSTDLKEVFVDILTKFMHHQVVHGMGTAV